MQDFIYDDDFIQAGLRDVVLETIATQKDNGPKVIGDVVLVWDSSRLTFADTDEMVDNPVIDNLVSKHESIVIETGCKYNANLVIGDRIYTKNLDLVIWNKKLNKRFRTSSDFIKRINP